MEEIKQIKEDVITIKGMLTALSDRLNQPVNTIPADEVLTVGQAADLLNLTSATVYGLVHERRIPFSKPGNGGRLCFLRSDLMQWVRDGRRTTTNDLDEQARSVVARRLDRRNQSKKRKGGL